MGAPPRTTRLTTKITTIPEATTTKTTTTPLTKTSTKSPRLSSKTPFKCLPLFVIAFLILLSSYKCDAKNANSILNFAKPQFSQWNENVTYVSTTRYNPRGMAPLYVGANMVVNMFFEKNPIPDGYIIVKERTIELGPKVENNDWSDLLKQYWGLLLVITLTALLVVLMPIIGLCFCCCRCAGACGGRSQPFDKKHDTCRRIFLGFLLIGAATGLLFGVVVAFVTNSYMQEGIEDVTTTAKDGMIDTKRYLDSTSSQINHLLVENYNELSQHLEDMLRTTADVVITKLEEKSKAISLKRLTDFVEHLPKMKEDLQRMKHITNELRVNASQLNDGLRGVKRELLVSLTKCSADSCKEILVKYEIGKLDANGIDYNQLPDVTEIIDSVSDLLSQKVIDNISKGKNVLNTMKQKLNETIDQNTPQVTNAINKAGKAIGSAAHEISGQIRTVSDIVGNNTDKGTRMADDYINAYSIYRFYLGIAISSLLLLVLVSVTLALFCGICGKRPGGYGDDCCNKGSGSRFLMLGVAVIFLTISILAIASLAHFLVGIIIQRGVCVPLRNTTDQVFNYIDEYIDLNHVLYPKNKRTKALISYANEYPPFRISHVIESCQQNHSIYEVMRLHNIFDIREVLEYPDKFKINETLQKLVDSIQLDLSDQILDDQAKENIRSLAKSKLENFEAHKFSQYLSDNITNQSLIVIADKLRETAERIPSSPDMTPIKTSLKNQALHLETYQEKLVKPMTDQSLEVLNLAENLETIIRPNGLSFEDYINSLLQEVTDAQDYINTNGTDFVKQVASELVGGFKNDIQSYLDLIVNSTQTYVGQCGPLANVYNALIVAGCNKVVDPFNGFWVGVGWCIIIFLPTLIISVKLSSLYQKSDPYPGPLVESEYLYDAYSERDNIPLANGPKNKRRKTKERRRGSRDRRGDYYEDSGSSHGTATGRDTRYTDMAPKHWDGGPPRYQNPPMAPPASEYERPPPYYYPGAQSDQD